MPVTGDLVDSTVVSRAAGARIGGVFIDAAEDSSQHYRPVIVIELIGEEECAGKAVILCTVVAVVLVRRDGVASEAVVLRHIGGQPVVMAEQERLTVASEDQLRRNGS